MTTTVFKQPKRDMVQSELNLGLPKAYPTPWTAVSLPNTTSAAITDNTGEHICVVPNLAVAERICRAVNSSTTMQSMLDNIDAEIKRVREFLHQGVDQEDANISVPSYPVPRPLVNLCGSQAEVTAPSEDDPDTASDIYLHKYDRCVISRRSPETFVLSKIELVNRHPKGVLAAMVVDILNIDEIEIPISETVRLNIGNLPVGGYQDVVCIRDVTCHEFEDVKNFGTGGFKSKITTFLGSVFAPIYNFASTSPDVTTETGATTGVKILGTARMKIG